MHKLFGHEDRSLTEKNERYIDRQSNFVATEKKSRMSFRHSTIECISIAQVWWNTKRIFNSHTRTFSRSCVEKNKLLLEKIELIH